LPRVPGLAGRWRAWTLTLFVLLALLCLGLAFGLDFYGHQRAGLNPSSSAWSASVGALLGWQGFHVLVLLLMGLFVCARQVSGKLLPNARASIDNTAVLWHYVTLQGVVGMVVIYLMPLI
ncbi:MAG: cytochrome ubiquinol oxidase subunit I, partial [Polaromonas sp.]|nr:cytochrome ubiquinol oxidase subunit I [Polaromonas sp.]